MRSRASLSIVSLIPFICFCLVISLFGWQFFMTPRQGELHGDIEMQYVTTTYSGPGGSDLFISTGYPSSFINSTVGDGSLSAPEGYERPNSNPELDVVNAGYPMGYVEGFDSGSMIAGKNYETLMVLSPNADVIIKLSQTEGFSHLTKNSENLQAYYGSSNAVIAQIFEEENWLDEYETEAAEFFDANGQSTGVTVVKEHGSGFWGREAVRYGTEITDYRGEKPWEYVTEFQTAPGLFIPAGSKAFVNGQYVYEVRTKVLEEAIGWKVFDGFEILSPSGQVICQYETKDELNKTSLEYVFDCGGTRIGSIFVNVNSRYVYTAPVSGWGYGCPEDGCVETTYKFTYQLVGETWAQKVENLKKIHLIMALMPDQVNMNSNYIQVLEEHTDAAIISIAKPVEGDAQNWAIAFAQEEDSTFVREAYETLILPALSR